MFHFRIAAVVLIPLTCCAGASAEDWWQFRGPGGLGVSADKGLPAEWSTTKNILWKTKLPGPGASSPMTVAGRVFVTCYTGYGVQAKDPGKQADLRRHLVCVDRKDGTIRWTKDFEPALPEHNYNGEGAYHGYAASTPATDGERLYVFFGKSGVFCFDLDGKQLWHAEVGKGTNGWGSGASPMLYKNLVVINASVETKAVIAFDKMNGKEVWRTAGESKRSWGTPMLVTTPAKGEEMVVSVEGRIVGLEPATGKELWTAHGIDSYVCPSVVAHDGIAYATGGGSITTAIKTGGRGKLTEKDGVLWRVNKGSNTPSPVYRDGYLYYANTKGGTVVCLKAATGESVYNERLKAADTFYSSPVLADGKLYYVSQLHGTFVLAVGPKFQLLAHNAFDDDKSRTNASPAVSNGQLLLRTDENLYCIGKRD